MRSETTVAVKESIMKTDMQLKADIADELVWDPAVNATEIGVIVKDGVATLTGHLDTFAEKHAVEHAVRRVSGVRGMALELDVKLSPEHKRSDSEIALAAVNALSWNARVPDEKVKVMVEDGHVTLTGEVDWNHQHATAGQCVAHLLGVRGLTNHVKVRPRASTKDIGTQISAVLARQATREARHIGIDVDGGVVTLRGKVHSMAEREATVGAALSTRGVSRVVDKLEIAA